MSDIEINLEKSDKGIWHIRESKCASSISVSESIRVCAEQLEVAEDEGGQPRLSIDGHMTREMVCSTCLTTIPNQNSSSDHITENKVEPRTPYNLLDSDQPNLNDLGFGSVICEPDSDSISPIITDIEENDQYESAFIDKRPIITVDNKTKYSEVVISVQPTGYQMNQRAIREIGDVIREIQRYANNELENQNKKITATVLPGKETETRSKDYSHQIILIRNILIEAVYPLVDNLADVFESSNLLARFSSDFTDTTDCPPAPRPGSPSPEPSDKLEGHAKHVSLTDKQPPNMNEYLSDKAIHASKRFEGKMSVDVQTDQGKVVATDNLRGNTTLVEFKDGDPVRYSCQCSSGIDPCEHVAAMFANLPPLSAVYIGA